MITSLVKISLHSGALVTALQVSALIAYLET
jgi:hypothetical protein